MVLENWVRGKIHELLGHYIEIDRESLKIGKLPIGRCSLADRAKPEN